MGSYGSKPDAGAMLEQKIQENCVVIFSKTTCPYCDIAKQDFRSTGAVFEIVELDNCQHGPDLSDALVSRTGLRTVPQVFVNGQCIGGAMDARRLHREGRLLDLIAQCSAKNST